VFHAEFNDQPKTQPVQARSQASRSLFDPGLLKVRPLAKTFGKLPRAEGRVWLATARKEGKEPTKVLDWAVAFALAEILKSVHIRGSHRAGPHAVGFGIAEKLSLAQIELQVSL
jgi:ligand-binding sensor domain-containing protein